MDIETLAKEYRAHFEAHYDNDAFYRYCSKRKVHLATPCINIVGSNGKSITGKILSDIYAKAGYKAGLLLPYFFDSPVEMIRVNGNPISAEDYLRIYNDKAKDFGKFELSPFEQIVAVAYEYFNEQKLDLCVLCACMGGEADATNIENLDQRLVVLTKVALDHTSYLGTTLSQIAMSKVALLREETPILVGTLDEDCKKVVADFADSLKSPFIEVDNHHYQHVADGKFIFDYRPFKELVVDSLGEASVYDASLAIEATKVLAKDFPVSEEAVRAALLEKPLPYRFDVRDNIIFDCANNVDAMFALVKAMRTLSKGRMVHVAFGCKANKNVAAMLPPLANYGCDIHLTSFDAPQAKGEDDFFIFLGDHDFTASPIELVKKLQADYPEDVVLVTGDPLLCHEVAKGLN